MNNTSEANSSSKNASGSSTWIVPSKAEGIAWSNAFILTSVFIVVGNLLTIVLFANNKTLRKKRLVLVINMAFADLMLAILSLSIRIFQVGSFYGLWTGKLLFSLIFINVVDIFFSQASLISATMISCERFYAIYWPFKQRTLSMRAYRIVIFMVWTIALLVSTVLNGLLYLASAKHALYAWMSCTLALTFIICGCNLGIWRKFQHGGVAVQLRQNRASQNKRLTKTLLFVSTLVLLSWLPLVIANTLRFNDVPITCNTYHMVTLLYYSNSFVNPIVYALRIPEFRQALGLCCFRRQAAMNMEHIGRRKNKAASMTPMAQLTTSQTDPIHLQLAFEQEVIDTRL